MTNTHPVEFVVVALYFGVLIGLAFVFRQLNRNVDDYFRNGCRGTWWLVGMSSFIGNYTAWTFTGAAGVAFTAGWSVMVIFMVAPFCSLITALFFADKFRQLRAVTTPEVLRKRYGESTEQFYSYFGIINSLLITSIQLYGLSIFISAIFGANIQATIVFIGIIVLTYSFFGGSWAVMGTDFIQGLILVPITLFVCLLCLLEVGGPFNLLSMIREQGLADNFQMFNTTQFEDKLSDFTIAWAIAIFLKAIPNQLSMISAVRYFAVKDGKEARKAAILDCTLSTTGLLFWFIPPITARLLYEDRVLGAALSKPEESAYAVAALEVLPAGMAGVMVIAMLAATMSNLDTGLNRNAAIFTINIYPSVCRWLGKIPATGEKLLRLGQAWTLMLGIIIISTALYLSQQEGSGVFEFMLQVGALLGMPIAIPMLLGILIKRVPGWAALLSIFVTAIPSTLAAFSGKVPWLADLLPFMAEPWKFHTIVFVNAAAGIGSFLLSAPFWPRSSQAYKSQVDAFFKTMNTPIDFETEVGGANDRQQLRIIGRFLIIVGAGLLLLLFVDNPWTLDGRWGIILVSFIITSLGGAFSHFGYKADSTPPPAPTP